ncbi:hypothetical protein A4G19_08640 [Pasteurellaceae bacterium Macca]|nr:hypothetical protein [Pasteurellaceae bacterium Macca]
MSLDSLFKHGHKIPQLYLTVTTPNGDKNDLSQVLTERCISLTLTDSRGFEADQLDITLDDSDNAVQLPSRDAVLELAIGWKGEPLVSKGKYTVDEVEYQGGADSANQFTIRARSADLKGSLSTKMDRSFHKITVEKLIEVLAKENDLEPLVAFEFIGREIFHLDQTNESTINLLTRLAEEYDAIATVKNGYLMFLRAGLSQSATGKKLPDVQFIRKEVNNFQFSLAEGDNYTAVRAYWHNQDTGEKGEIVIDENSEIKREHWKLKGRTTAKKTTSKTVKKANKRRKAKKKKPIRQFSKNKKNVLYQHAPVESDANQMKTLRKVYKYKAGALQAAKSAFDKMKRGIASLNLDLPEGQPELFPEIPVQVSGFKPEIDATEWIIKQVEHSLSTDSGYTMRLELEMKVDEKPKEIKEVKDVSKVK